MTMFTQAADPGTAQPRRPGRYLPVLVIASLVLGLSIGAAIRGMASAGWSTTVVEFFDIIGTMWVNAIRMTVIPLIVPSPRRCCSAASASIRR